LHTCPPEYFQVPKFWHFVSKGVLFDTDGIMSENHEKIPKFVVKGIVFCKFLLYYMNTGQYQKVHFLTLVLFMGFFAEFRP
jgi:hypothetical protein